ncbi:MAG TPA: hypothetical protein VGR97_11625 [Candidatus Acidoferrales bacterium]|nr:hypothetical protein [Candidatus Acidoferrales bacterium]
MKKMVIVLVVLVLILAGLLLRLNQRFEALRNARVNEPQAESVPVPSQQSFQAVRINDLRYVVIDAKTGRLWDCRVTDGSCSMMSLEGMEKWKTQPREGR